MNSIEMKHDNVCDEFAKLLEKSNNTYKVFGFSHVIIINSIADIMDTAIRTIIDGMYRKTKLHCKNDAESKVYRERLGKLYLTYLERGLTNIDCLEPKLADILTVNIENSVPKCSRRLSELRTKVAQRSKRLQSLFALQSRMKTDTVLAEWVISKVGPAIHEAKKDLSNLEYVSSNDIVSIPTSLKHIENSVCSLELD